MGDGLIKKLEHYADDPMWADHAEVPKHLLREAIAAIVNTIEVCAELAEQIPFHHAMTAREAKYEIARAIRAQSLRG